MKTLNVVIPARKGSVRIPAKNNQLINGETLLMRKIRQTISIPGINKVIVATDDEKAQESVEKAGAVFYRQPDEFCQGNNPNGMIKDALASFESDLVLWAHCTNPFIGAAEYFDAWQALSHMEAAGYDSLFSVNQLNGHFWNQQPSPINFSPTAPQHKLASHLAPLYAQNGGIFIRPYKAMAEDGLFVSGKAYMFPMDEITGWDIDHPWQLQFAQLFDKEKINA